MRLRLPRLNPIRRNPSHFTPDIEALARAVRNGVRINWIMRYPNSPMVWEHDEPSYDEDWGTFLGRYNYFGTRGELGVPGASRTMSLVVGKARFGARVYALATSARTMLAAASAEEIEEASGLKGEDDQIQYFLKEASKGRFSPNAGAKSGSGYDTVWASDVVHMTYDMRDIG